MIATSGLAATITALAGTVSDILRTDEVRTTQRCEIAGEILRDDALTPYISDAERRRAAEFALRAFEAGMKG